MSFDMTNGDNRELIQKARNYFDTKKPKFDEMYRYYEGKSHAMKDYLINNRSSRKIRVNFMKKFIKEEVSYAIGNDINYISKSGNTQIITDIDLNLAHWSKQHDSNLMRQMLIYGYSFELYYTDNQGQFCSKIITPREGYAFVDDLGNIIFFMRIFERKFDSNVYIDVYDDTNIYHYINNFNTPYGDKPIEQHYFGDVPVSITQVSEEKEYDTIFNDIKDLQDAYETNLSDISNEISDFRNSYLGIYGFQIKEEDIDKMKEQGIIQVPNDKGRAEWIIKNINDSFIQNTLNTEEDKMYQLTSHINHNEKMQSNLSGVALRSRLISLEEKCKLNTKAFADAVTRRLKFLFIYLSLRKSKSYDYKDIKLKFTPNVPQDDLSASQIINQLGDKLSKETALSLLSFIDNPSLEAKKAKEEQEEAMPNVNLDNYQNNKVVDNNE